MAESEWLYSRSDNDQQGPVSSKELHRLAKAGELRPDDLVWKTGMPEWLPAREIKGLNFPSQSGDGRKPSSGRRFDPEAMQATFHEAQRKADEVAGTLWFLDLKFNRFVSRTIIQSVWTLYLVMGSLGIVLGFIGAILNFPILEAVAVSAASLFGFVFLTLLLRLALEGVMVLFRIADDLRQLNQKSVPPQPSA